MGQRRRPVETTSQRWRRFSEGEPAVHRHVTVAFFSSKSFLLLFFSSKLSFSINLTYSHSYSYIIFLPSNVEPISSHKVNNDREERKKTFLVNCRVTVLIPY